MINLSKIQSLFYEEVESIRGGKLKRVKSSLFLWSALIFFVVGILLLTQQIPIGGFILLTIMPCLILYPAVRYLLGGKDSLLAAIITVILEESIKYKLTNRSGNKKKR